MKGSDVMLINFKTKNYKSFKDGFDFTMKASRVRDLEHSLLRCDKSSKKILPSAVVYGPNAAGKTTVIETFLRFKDIVLNGNIENSSSNRGNMVSGNLELIPFIYNEIEDPIEFDIEFEYEKIEYRYFLKFIIGKFLSKGKREILEELLEVDGKRQFLRTNLGVDVYFKNINSKLINDGLNVSLWDSYQNIFNSNIEPTTLFLSTEFRSLVSKEIYNAIYKWFSEKLLIFTSFDHFRSGLYSDEKEIVEVPKELYEAVSKIGVLATNMFYQRKDESEFPMLLSRLDLEGKKVLIPSSIIESVGTLHFIDLFPALLSSLTNGVTLIIDELDSSLHPMVIMSVVSLYHNPDINKHNAQLIFNTHNPIYLNNSVFRRDEMCFVEKNGETKISEFYKLSDFKTNSNNPTRKTTDYINNYFMNKYGAIEYVDLSEVFEKIMNKG